MKILVIVPYPIFPPDEGGRIRAYNLLKHLAPDHDLVLLTPHSPANAGNDLPARVYETTPAGARHQILSPGFLRSATHIMRGERPDVVLSEYPWPGLHGAYLALRARVPLVLDAPNVEGDRFRATGRRTWPLVALYERLVMRLASRIFVVSDDDRARFVRNGVRASKIKVVPNGVDPAVMHPDATARARIRAELAIDDATRMLLFFGQLDYAPNRKAIDVITRELLPRLDRSGARYETVVCGKGDIDRLRALYARPHLRFAGAVPRIAPYINAADAVLAPLRSGGGTRLKILESIACATPVVSTSIGAEGIDRFACGDLLRIADDWDAFAAYAASVPPVKGGNAPAGFLDMYSWANIVRRIDWPGQGEGEAG